MTDLNPELIAKAADALDSRHHLYRIDVDTWRPYCICGWTATEAYDTAAYERHVAVAVLEAVADDLRAEGAVQALEAAADEVDSLYFGPDQHTPFTRGAALRWGAKQAVKRVRARAAKLRGATL